jgi:hypothetical protein
MLPSSASTTSNLAVTGVSGTVENRPARQVKLRNTSDPVGAENPVTSCDLHVLVYEAAEPVSLQRPDGCSGVRGSGACGRTLMQRSVRPVRVVMLGELA